MSISRWFITPIFHKKKEIIPAICVRAFCDQDSENQAEEPAAETNTPNPRIRKQHSVETCMQYMESEAYKVTYGDKPVWHVYVRNFKGGLPPQTRKTCIRFGEITTGSPCPICRDQYLLPHYLNVKLLKQFISPEGGEILQTKKTGVCQKQQFNLTVAIKKAQNYGLLSFTVPHRSYDYSLYDKKQ